jgi:TolB-like protein
VVADRYRILRFVAQGGMGEVYEAEDQALGEVLALKTIRPTVAADEVAVGLFKREIQVARQVTHRNVCRIYDLGTHRSDSPIAALYLNHEILFVTMELLHGASLAHRLDGAGAMTPREALPLIEQMASALDAAHAAGVVHRDFKSANVVLEAMDTGTRAVVTDFGLARGSQQTGGASGTLTVASAVMGSPAYMAPEQVEGGQITPAADIYALGVVIYEMTVGRVPFEGDSALSTAVKRLTEDPPPPSQLVEGFDPHWEEVILRCLERDPDNRYRRASDVVRALKGKEEAADFAPITAAKTESPGKRMTKVVLAGVLLGLAVVANWYMWTKRAQEQAEFGYLQAPSVARPAVAVMEFRNLTGQQEVDWLASGLPEMLSSELSAGSGVRIIPGENVVRAKLELGLEEDDEFTDETLQILRRNLGTDYVVTGSYTAVAGGGEGQLRLDLRLQDTLTTDQSAVVTVSGPASEIFDLVADAGSELRDALDLETEAEAKRSYRMASAEAARLYSEGLARLRAYDALGASELLEQAAAADPRNPRVHAAWASALAGLGYVEKAQEEAKLAMELSGPLGEEERLAIRGGYLESTGDWLGATDVYDQLFGAARPGPPGDRGAQAAALGGGEGCSHSLCGSYGRRRDGRLQESTGVGGGGSRGESRAGCTSAAGARAAARGLGVAKPRGVGAGAGGYRGGRGPLPAGRRSVGRGNGSGATSQPALRPGRPGHGATDVRTGRRHLSRARGQGQRGPGAQQPGGGAQAAG